MANLPGFVLQGFDLRIQRKQFPSSLLQFLYRVGRNVFQTCPQKGDFGWIQSVTAKENLLVFFGQDASYQGCGRAGGIGNPLRPAEDAGSDPAESILSHEGFGHL